VGAALNAASQPPWVCTAALGVIVWSCRSPWTSHAQANQAREQPSSTALPHPLPPAACFAPLVAGRRACRTPGCPPRRQIQTHTESRDKVGRPWETRGERDWQRDMVGRASNQANTGQPNPFFKRNSQILSLSQYSTGLHSNGPTTYSTRPKVNNAYKLCWDLRIIFPSSFWTWAA
jgi:hypothetical protein